jgi:hypothetical protein
LLQNDRYKDEAVFEAGAFPQGYTCLHLWNLVGGRRQLLDSSILCFPGLERDAKWINSAHPPQVPDTRMVKTSAWFRPFPGRPWRRDICAQWNALPQDALFGPAPSSITHMNSLSFGS